MKTSPISEHSKPQVRRQVWRGLPITPRLVPQPFEQQKRQDQIDGLDEPATQDRHRGKRHPVSRSENGGQQDQRQDPRRAGQAITGIDKHTDDGPRLGPGIPQKPQYTPASDGRRDDWGRVRNKGSNGNGRSRRRFVHVEPYRWWGRHSSNRRFGNAALLERRQGFLQTSDALLQR